MSDPDAVIKYYDVIRFLCDVISSEANIYFLEFFHDLKPFIAETGYSTIFEYFIVSHWRDSDKKFESSYAIIRNCPNIIKESMDRRKDYIRKIKKRKQESMQK